MRSKRYVDYGARADDCVQFMHKIFPAAVRQQRIDGDEKWVWSNIDNDLFTFNTEAEACADICRDMGVTTQELDAFDAFIECGQDLEGETE